MNESLRSSGESQPSPSDGGGQPSTGNQLSPGERLRRAKEAKASRKSSARGQDAEQIEQKAESAIRKRFEGATRWAGRNRGLAVVGGLLLVGLGVGGVYLYKTKVGTEQELTKALEKTLEKAVAPVGDAPPTPEGEEEKPGPRYKNGVLRAQAARKGFANLSSSFSSTDASVWADLGKGAALLREGKYKDADLAFNSALKEAGKDAIVSWRALEGLGQSAVARKKWNDAQKRYKQLKAVAGGRFSPLARFRLAKVDISRGKAAVARKDLEKLQKDLRKKVADKNSPWRELLSQVDEEIRWIDAAKE